jgi:superfamily II DNA/RNA helicase
MTFSATLNDGLKNIVTKYLGVDYTFLKIHTEVVVDRIDHGFVDVPHFEKFDMLLRYLDSHSDDKIIIFTQTKRDVAELAERLEEK